MISHRLCLVLCVLALQILGTLQQVPTGGICDESKYKTDGTAYVAHPYHCDQYIQCYHDVHADLQMAVTRNCPTGLFWNPTANRCENTNSSQCKTDFCKFMCEPYPMKDNCRCYYDCETGVSVPKCCPDHYMFVAGKGCVKDKHHSCKAFTDMTIKCKEPECKKKPDFQHIGAYHFTVFGTSFWFGRTCVYKDFDALTCDCTAPRGHTCHADKSYDFTNQNTANRIRTRTMSGISISGANLGLSGLYLGPKDTLHIDVTSKKKDEPLTLKFRYRENPAVLSATYATILMTSNTRCSGNIYGTFVLYINPNFLSADIQTPDGRSDHVDVLTKGMSKTDFKDITMVYDNGYLALSVKSGNKHYMEVAQTSKDLTFPCGFDFGSNTDFDGFQGTIESLSLHYCTPAKFY